MIFHALRQWYLKPPRLPIPQSPGVSMRDAGTEPAYAEL